MPTLLFLFLVIVFLVVVAVAIYYVVGRSDSAVPALARAEQENRGLEQKNRGLELLVDEIRELAFEYRDTDSALSYKVTDKITDYNRKELS